MQIEVNINSPIFKDFVSALDSAILRCVAEIHAENFSGGEISAKINIEFKDAYEFYPAGQDETGTYRYKKPDIEHKVTLTLKKRAETKGTYTENLELERDGDRFILIEPQRAQMSLEEMEDTGHEND